jgi:hypothetical protein
LRLASQNDGLGLRHGGAQFYQYGGYCGNCRGRHRVHDDTQRAAIRTGLGLVRVRNLRHSEKRQQDETHHSHRRQKSGAAAFPEEMCLQSSQTNALSPLFYRALP